MICKGDQMYFQPAPWHRDACGPAAETEIEPRANGAAWSETERRPGTCGARGARASCPAEDRRYCWYPGWLQIRDHLT